MINMRRMLEVKEIGKGKLDNKVSVEKERLKDLKIKGKNKESRVGEKIEIGKRMEREIING